MNRQLMIFFTLVFYGIMPARAQQYFLWSTNNASDKVYQNGKLIQVHGTINLSKDLYVNNSEAMLHLQDDQGNQFTVAFKKGRKVILNLPDLPHSELYDIIVNDYLKDIRLSVSHLSGKSYDMDWVRYFNDFDHDTSKRLLVIEGEHVPLKSKFLTLLSGQKLFARVFFGRDSILHLLKIVNGDLVLDMASFGLKASQPNICQWKLELQYSGKDGRALYTDLSERINTQFIRLAELKSQIEFFENNNTIIASEKVEYLNAFLNMQYGKFNSIIVDPLIQATLDNR